MLSLVASTAGVRKTKKKTDLVSREHVAFRQARHSRGITLYDLQRKWALAFLLPSEDDPNKWLVERCDNGWKSCKPLSLTKAKQLALELLTVPEPTPPTVRRRLKSVQIASPTVPLAIERLQRVTCTIDHMASCNQLDEAQALAAERFRTALETTADAGGGMDFDRVRSGAEGPQMQPAKLAASYNLSQARESLYPEDFAVVEMIAGCGFSIKETTELLAIDRTKSLEHRRRLVGETLRRALSILARLWGLEVKPRTIGHIVGTNSKVDQGEAADVVYQSPYVHATARKIFHKS